MKLKHKLISMTVPMVLVTALSVGLFATSANRKGILQSIYYHLHTIADGYIESELRHRHRILRNAGLTGIKSFVEQYQAEALEAAAGLAIGEDEHFAVIDGEGVIRYTSHDDFSRDHATVLIEAARELIARQERGLWEKAMETNNDREKHRNESGSDHLAERRGCTNFYTA